MDILETKDYAMFKFFENNRKVIKVDHLIESLKKENLLSVNPIICTKEMYIIDGQHRLTAAKKLGIPVFYTYYTGNSAPDGLVELCNSSQRTWKPENFLQFYIDDPWIKFISDTINKYKISFTQFRNVFCLSDRKTSLSSVFKLKVPSYYSEEVIIDYCEFFSKIRSEIEKKDKKIFTPTRLFSCLFYFYKETSSVDRKHLSKSIIKNLDKVNLSGGIKQLKLSIAEIYNKKAPHFRRLKIDMDGNFFSKYR